MPNGSSCWPGDGQVEGHELGDGGEVAFDPYRVSTEDVEPGRCPCSRWAANGNGEEGRTSLG